MINKETLLKIGAFIVPVIAFGANALAEYIGDKERDSKYVSKEELEEILNNKKESK